jgi:transposase
MAKQSFKEYPQGQGCLFPMYIEELIPHDSPVRLVNKIVDGLDLTKIINTYKGGGTSGYHPRMMLKIILFAYLNNIYSCRKIEEANRYNILYMWLSAGQTPDHNTINIFRSQRLKDTIHDIFTQVVLKLVESGQLSLDVVYVDGTKVESRAGRYTFVWKKTVEKNKEKLESKIRKVLEQVEEGIAQDGLPEDDPSTPIRSAELKRCIDKMNTENGSEKSKNESDTPKNENITTEAPSAAASTPIRSEELTQRVAQINTENLSDELKKEVKMLKNKCLPKLAEYEKKLGILGDRNSYSKTDESATFMHMKDDHMGNGQLKPAYNLQIATENQYIVHTDMYSNRNDTLTFPDFMKGFKKRYAKMPKKSVADAGYGSEENYDFTEANNIEPFIKYNIFEEEQKDGFKNNLRIAQNLYYNEESDYFVCPMGQHMENTGSGTRRSESGFVSHVKYYEARNCCGCPLKCLCHKAEGNRRIEVNPNLNRHRERVRNLLNSEEGKMLMKRRATEPESVFGQTKYNKHYNRFRHFGKDGVMTDFAIFAVAFNIGKLFNKKGTNVLKALILTFFVPIWS